MATLYDMGSFDGWTSALSDTAACRAELLARGGAYGGLEGTLQIRALTIDGVTRKTLFMNNRSHFVGSSVLWGTLRSTFSMGAALNTDTPSTGHYINLFDENGVELLLVLRGTSWTLSYNPAGTANDISASGNISAMSIMFAEMVWTPSNFKLFLNNKEVYSKAWTGVTGRLNAIGAVDVTSASRHILNYYLADQRIGMCSVIAATLAAPSSDTSASVTGAATRQAALASFDGNTSYVTYTEGSGQLTDLPLTATLPASSTIHAIKVTGQAAGDGGVASGRIRLGAPAGVANAVPLEMGLSYSPTAQIYHSDINVDPFDVADLNAGNITVGIEEG